MGKLEDWNHDQRGVIRYYGKCFVEGCEERSAKYRWHFPAREGFLTNGRFSTGEIDIMSCEGHQEEAEQEVLKMSETPQEFDTVGMKGVRCKQCQIPTCRASGEIECKNCYRADLLCEYCVRAGVVAACGCYKHVRTT